MKKARNQSMQYRFLSRCCMYPKTMQDIMIELGILGHPGEYHYGHMQTLELNGFVQAIRRGRSTYYFLTPRGELELDVQFEKLGPAIRGIHEAV